MSVCQHKHCIQFIITEARLVSYPEKQEKGLNKYVTGIEKRPRANENWDF